MFKLSEILWRALTYKKMWFLVLTILVFPPFKTFRVLKTRMMLGVEVVFILPLDPQFPPSGQSPPALFWDTPWLSPSEDLIWQEFIVSISINSVLTISWHCFMAEDTLEHSKTGAVNYSLCSKKLELSFYEKTQVQRIGGILRWWILHKTPNWLLTSLA